MPKKIPQSMQASCMDCEARKFAWFEPGSADELLSQRQVYRNSQSIYEPGEYLFAEGDVHPMAYTLKEGWAICYKQLLDGQRQVVHVALPGDFLGYQTDFSERIDYSVMAVTECKFCGFTPAGIESLLEKDLSLIKRLMEIQNKQNKSCKRTLSVVGQAQAKSKVAYFLADLVERLERRGLDIEETLAFPLSREDIADAIGITPVHLSRVSVELSNAHVVECRHNKLKVMDIPALQHLAEAVF
ncbi:MAG: cAMP-binding proteins-catabolite gene activator and regulatory subunit of cAMP-dependent protein kinases [uncultured Thiotrichaceae bacterium]|uniref:cAMP-binding proteins-catabolite gene activator and regulatory subunit of cAMP-dependent protein kinases n=1 Tax=uncultured Thiotrichaceae bacterium TaxID=298394 RepID=A0A6S6UHF0_9GAMM|nr:MAG: cAMP-binding proteins-catabolite gene activator and regulatory subunit of cAMP-dependent protein kinases [uncultured Thiotrichaceae bacterium]